MSYNNTYISNQNLNLLDEIENQIQNITGLPNLESIDNISIPSTVWPFVHVTLPKQRKHCFPFFSNVMLHTDMG